MSEENASPGSESTAQTGAATSPAASPNQAGKEAAPPVPIEPKELGEQNLDDIVKVKIDGKVEKMTVRELMRLNSLEKASHQRMQQAAQKERAMDELMSLSKKDRNAFMQKMGVDPYEWAEATLAEKYELMTATPEQKRIRELETETKKYKEDEKTRTDHQKAQKTAMIQQQAMETLDKEIGDAWKESGLPKEKAKFYITRVAARLLEASKQKIPLTAKDALLRVKNESSGEVRGLLETLDAEAIREMLGPKVLKALSDYEVKRVTEKSASHFGSNQSKRPASAASEGPKKQLNEREWREHVDRLAKSL